MKIALDKKLILGERVKFYFDHDPQQIEYWGVARISISGKVDIEPKFIIEDNLEYLEPAK